ncbi:hypothetical protein SAMN05444162_3533 [Paenibacillaceae bacterium GAS479]|nr:hypothetical protein SAMN05444162_3533 [Paenibacillaceae bacterium GAS479]
MNITIEDNQLVYIYLKNQEKYIYFTGTKSSVKCYFQLDDDNNWVGIRIAKEYSYGGAPLLPEVGQIDYINFEGTVQEDEHNILITFDTYSKVCRELEQDCNLDLIPEGIYGIEIILWLANVDWKKEKIQKYIIVDI